MIQWLQGNCRRVLPTLPPQSVHTVITSPPYWGLRDYGVHERGGIGLEETFDEWLTNIVDVFTHVWRVLRDDGTLWLNLGDAYNSGASGFAGGFPGEGGYPHGHAKQRSAAWKPKDLMGQPWRVAFALQDAGWYLRSDIIWHKPNPMPESVQDRPTKSHEYVFLLTKRPRYYYDAKAIREDAKDWGTRARETGQWSVGGVMPYGQQYNGLKNGNNAISGRNKRTVWTIPPQPYSNAHFATFPPKLVEPCILAGTSAYGCCAVCGAPWKRVVERTDERDESYNGSRFDQGKTFARDNGERTQGGERFLTRSTGWHPQCTCEAGVIPCTVLDPFGGAGTTALVAERFARDAISIELNAAYHAMAQQRVSSEAPLFHGIGA